MSTTGVAGLLALLDRLQRTLDDLLALDLTQVAQADLPTAVQGLVTAGHRLHAAQLDAIGAFDAADLAAASRHRTTTRWIEHRTRATPGQAAAWVRTARAVRDHLPATRHALAAGTISAGHAAAITHVVHTVGVEHAVDAEPVLLDLARHAEPSVLRRATAHLHAVLDPHGAQATLDKVYDNRGVTLSVVGHRAYLDGVLDLEAAEALRAALAPLMTPTPTDDRTTPQRRADALTDLARRALDAGDLPVLGGQQPHLTVVIEGRALAEGRGAATLPWTGAAVPATTILRWACHARLLPVWAHATATGGQQPLAVGRTSRTVTPAQLKALHVRDGGCVHPGCTRTPAYCHAHHIHHWADGGPTDLPNLVLLCPHHHRTLHAHHWALHHHPADGTRPHDWIAAYPDGHTTPYKPPPTDHHPYRPPDQCRRDGGACLSRW